MPWVNRHHIPAAWKAARARLDRPADRCLSHRPWPNPSPKSTFTSSSRQRIARAPCPTRFAPTHAYLGGTFKGLGCFPIEINTEPDHLHALFLLARTKALSDVVGHLKKSSNDWLRSQGPQFAGFFWQAGFGAFSVSQSQAEDVRAYIRNQREHHRGKSFRDELRAFLKAYEVEFDERYVWD